MSSDNPQKSHAVFDQALRHAHAASLDRLSPRVQAQLAQRRRAALAQNARPMLMRVRPMLALGSAAAVTLAVGLYAMRGAGDTALPTTSTVVATTAVATAPDATTPAAGPETTAHSTPKSTVANAGTPPARTAVDSLLVDGNALPPDLLAAEFTRADDAMGLGAQDESPDFYLWLGSQDAQSDVTESL